MSEITIGTRQVTQYQGSTGPSSTDSEVIKEHYGTDGFRIYEVLRDAIDEFNRSHPESKVVIQVSFDGKIALQGAGVELLPTHKIDSTLQAAKSEGWIPSAVREADRIKIQFSPRLDSKATSAIVVGLLSDPQKPKGVHVPKHPYYGDVTLDAGHSTDFLTGFDPRVVNTVNQTNGEDLAKQLKPIDDSLPFNAEQIYLDADYAMSSGGTDAINLNSDLGFRYTLQNVLRGKVVTTTDQNGLEQPSFVILSHGHSVAGLAELSKMTRTEPDGKVSYLFDTSIYMPSGGWGRETPRLNVASVGAQIWGDEIASQFSEYQSKGIGPAGGVAIALNGHRGDLDIKTMGVANIDPDKMLGSPREFKAFLTSRNLNRVVIVTEHYVDDPSKPNILTLEHLVNSNSATFDDSNKDLYEYMKALQELGVEIIVVSGEQRTNYKIAP